jgi:probable rRNA maturation factor
MATRKPSQVLLSSRHPSGDRFTRFVSGRARKFLRYLRLGHCELSLSLVTDREIRKLNRTFRKKDKATDVLSFPAGEGGPTPQGVPKPLGDVVISVDTAARCAEERGVAIERELELYLAHGLLHLLGYDHHRPEEARKMARKEAQLLGCEGMLQSG